MVRFYLFDEPRIEGGKAFTLIDTLDRTRLLSAGDKATAKEWAKRLGEGLDVRASVGERLGIPN